MDSTGTFPNGRNHPDSIRQLGTGLQAFSVLVCKWKPLTKADLMKLVVSFFQLISGNPYLKIVLDAFYALKVSGGNVHARLASSHRSITNTPLMLARLET